MSIIPDNKPRYAEQVTHRTASRPYSIHYTEVTDDVQPALYIHYHNEMELFYMESGELDMYIEDALYHLKAGDAIFIPPNQLHYAKKAAGLVCVCSFRAFVFDFAMIMDVVPVYCRQYTNPVFYNSRKSVIHFDHSLDWHDDIINVLLPVYSRMHSDVESVELELRGRLLIIWQLMYNNHFNSIHNNHAYTRLYSQLSTCIDHINNNYADNIELSGLASICGLSEGHFCRVFREFTGYTPFTYINRIRILKSCDYLKGSDKSIADIAILCGYNNISYYNRTFLKIMHETPSAYRKVNQS